ncbi:hypothetical protein [Streptomyces sp. NPDC024089]|uniref:hypothetical protein n=1 Tax=Streptomyces sp. NPDC024089 TaxID=3154328 RepID=UPI0033DE4D5E
MNDGGDLRYGNVYARGAAMVFVVVISVVLVGGSISYIVHLFRRDSRIRSQGRDVRALVEDVRFLGSNDGGSANIKYRLSWTEDGVTKQVEGSDTVSAFYSSRVQKGCEIDIKYLDDNNIMFVFDK